MKLELFREDHFQEYQSWFTDIELNKRLGPIDKDWLDHVLNEENGRQYAFTDGKKLVAVAGIILPNGLHDYYTLTDMAVCPKFKNQGLGSKVLKQLIEMYHSENKSWKAHVDHDNEAAIQFFKKNGWSSDHTLDNENMICFILP